MGSAPKQLELHQFCLTWINLSGPAAMVTAKVFWHLWFCSAEHTFATCVPIISIHCVEDAVALNRPSWLWLRKGCSNWFTFRVKERTHIVPLQLFWSWKHCLENIGFAIPGFRQSIAYKHAIEWCMHKLTMTWKVCVHTSGVIVPDSWQAITKSPPQTLSWWRFTIRWLVARYSWTIMTLSWVAGCC